MGDTRQSVLIVDDARLTAIALRDLLIQQELRAEAVHDGEEAVRRVQQGRVDLVLLDIELPGMDGLEILRRIRSDARVEHLPVLMLSAHQNQQKRITALQLGADDVLHKPWDEAELLARIRRQLVVRERMAELVAQRDELKHLAVTDGLTQLNNHRSFQDRLREEFRRAQRYDDPLALILVELDHFSQVNERSGHVAGDRVLRDVASTLRQAVRDTDLLARYGGQTFAALLPKTHLGGALTLAERIWRGVASVRAGAGTSNGLTASLGVSGFPQRSVMSPEQLLKTSDEALQRARNEGRNRICLFQQASFFSEPSSHSS